MASTFTTDEAAASYPVASHGLAGNLKVASAVHEISAALVVSDVIQMVKLPANAVIVDVVLVTDDLDTSGTPAIALDVGYGTDPNYFISASTVAQAGGVARSAASTAHPLKLSAEDTIDITVSTAPATGTTTGTLSLTVLYFVDPNFSAT